MRDYAKIYTALWRSKKFTGLPDDECRLLYLYLHTCPHVNSVGCFVLPEGYALTDLGWPAERYRYGIDTLTQAGLIGYHGPESLIRLVDFLRHDPFCNSKHAISAVRIALALPDCSEKQRLIDDLRAQKWVREDMLPAEKRYRLDTVSIGSCPEPEPEPEPEPYSVPDGTGGKPPVRASLEGQRVEARSAPPADPAKAVFDAAIGVLGACGVPASTARRMAGKWRREHPGKDGEILAAIIDCGRAGAVDPIPWIEARLRPRPQPDLSSIFAKLAAEDPLP